VKSDYTAARRHLARADPKLGLIIKRVGPCQLHAVAPRDPFEALCRSIASQQLSVKAAATIFGRFCDLFPPGRKPTPERVMTLTDDQIRAAGFSRPKAAFIKDLAARVLDGRGLTGYGLTGYGAGLPPPIRPTQTCQSACYSFTQIMEFLRFTLFEI